jgi:regulator of replication initiation timing
MKLPSVDSIETLSLAAMRRLVAGLVGKMQEFEAQVEALRSENQKLREDNERLKLENDSLRLENQLLRDEIARLKNLPPRPPFRSSGVEKASEPATGKNNASKRGRSTKRDRDQITREVVIKANAPQGSRFKGYETILVRELVLSAEVVRYRRERWVTPDGKTVVARLPDGIAGGIGPGLRQFCLTMHAQGQVTTERLTSILNGIGVEISKRWGGCQPSPTASQCAKFVVLAPRKGEAGIHEKGYHHRHRSGKERLSAAWGSN